MPAESQFPVSALHRLLDYFRVARHSGTIEIAAIQSYWASVLTKFCGGFLGR
jgi:hypothetical protein